MGNERLKVGSASSASRRAIIASSGAALALALSRGAAWAGPRGEGAETLPPDYIRERYMIAPPEALGASCLVVDYLLFFTPLARKHKNFNIHTDFFGHDVTIDQSNVDRYEKLLTERQGICASVIEKRGYESFAGTYAARANAACAEARAPAYLTNINELTQGSPPTPGTVETITQQGFRVSMVNKALAARNPEALKIRGMAVENVLILEDGLSPDFNYTGTRSGRDIVMRPTATGFARNLVDMTVLARCAITLSPVAAP